MRYQSAFVTNFCANFLLRSKRSFCLAFLLALAALAGCSANLLAQPATSAGDQTESPAATKSGADDRAKLYEQVRCFADLEQLTRDLASKPFVPVRPLPEAAASLSYDQYIDIKFKYGKAVWWSDALPFWIETFHRGFVQKDRVDMFVIDQATPDCEKSTTTQLPYDSDNFEYGKSIDEALAKAISGRLGHAGFKVAGRFAPRPDGEEMLTMLGSSYFRARSATTYYGSSTRALAIDIALNKVEEFPAFRAHWLCTPDPKGYQLRILSHVDSPSVSGAYEFFFTPGDVESSVDVKATLFFRAVPEKLAIAPLTSMWIWGDGLRGPPKDARPSVHDSDGLLVEADGKWTWRPYARLAWPSVSSQPVKSLKGFGVLQRNRNFLHYDDHNARYDKRPSVWVAPKEPWTNGRVELLEIPGAHEGVDNIGAYWVADGAVDPAVPQKLAYKVSFFPGDPGHQQGVARSSHFDVHRLINNRFKIDVRFSGKELDAVKKTHNFRIATKIINGKLESQQLVRTETGDCIVDLIIDREDRPETDQAPIDLKVWLTTKDKQPLTETFSYLCPIAQPEFVYPAVYTRSE